MPIKGPATKRHKQSLERRKRNRGVKSTVNTAKRRFLEAAKKGDKEAAEQNFLTLTKLIDTAARKNVYHKNNAARKKSRMHKVLNTMDVK